MANVLLVAERRGRVSEGGSTEFLALLQDLPIEVDSSPISLPELLATGRLHGLSAYDTAYLLLAMRSGLPVASLDSQLLAAMAAVGVERWAAIPAG